jgi:pyridoxine/pyridoxamine 5'-phosphate oxidase
MQDRPISEPASALDVAGRTAELAAAFSAQRGEQQTTVHAAQPAATRASLVQSIAAPSSIMPDDQELEKELEQLAAQYQSQYGPPEPWCGCMCVTRIHRPHQARHRLFCACYSLETG